MQIETRQENNHKVALVAADEKLIVDAQSALDLAMTVHYETDARRIAIAKEAIKEEFFILSSGLAGEILQKLVNYQFKIAVYGDFSGYTSKPLKDFMYESNKGCHVFFVATKEDAVKKLTAA